MPPPSSGDLNPTDELLVERVRSEDERALGLLYDRHAGTVLAIARGILGDEADAEEITESVFLEFWNKVELYDEGRASVRGYLAVMSRSRALDRVRARRRHQGALERASAREAGAIAIPISRPADDPERDLVRREARSRLAGMLAILGHEQREAIELAYFEGLSQSEIATATGAPLGTVKTRIRDGMKHLRDSVAVREGER